MTTMLPSSDKFLKTFGHSGGGQAFSIFVFTGVETNFRSLFQFSLFLNDIAF